MNVPCLFSSDDGVCVCVCGGEGEQGHLVYKSLCDWLDLCAQLSDHV